MRYHNPAGWIGWLLAALLVPATATGLELHFQTASEAIYGEPHDIVLSPDGKRLYVADNGRDRIAVLDSMSLQMLGEFGSGQVSQPHDVVFDRDGRLLVADTGNSRIAVYRVSGSGATLVDSIRGGVRRPEGVAVHPDGRVLATGAASGNLVAFRDGRVVQETGGFSGPHDVEVDAEGRIWVADANNDRIVLIGDDWGIARELGGDRYAFRGPRYLDFDAAGRMYVADKYSNSIKIIATDGALLKVIGGPNAGNGPGLFDRPEGVEIRGDDIWFSDTYNDRIVRYRLAD